ncbi:MAG: 3-isopropylmalate dehydratase small subunit [Acidobacteria bacterium]|nr:3-isopropylmalate dehydratase small subunit [Acidobacteriota bacterium]
MEAFTKITSSIVPLPNESIDTDIIIPARFLKITDKADMEKYLFHDWRFDEQGNPRPDFILNQPRARGAKILLAGGNFGSGSSREHAPWALMAFGFRAILSTSFADIFQGNSLKNGLLPVVVPQDIHAELFRMAETDPGMKLTIDLALQSVMLPDGRSVTFPIDGFAKRCLLSGVDQLGYLLKNEEHIRAYENEHPPAVQTTARSLS